MIETTLAESAHAKKQESLLALFKKLGHFLGSTRKTQLTILLLLMFVSSFAEMLSIGAVLPFLGVLTSPEAAFKSKYLQPLIQFFDISTTHELLALLCLVFAGAILLANLPAQVLTLPGLLSDSWMMTGIRRSLAAKRPGKLA